MSTPTDPRIPPPRTPRSRDQVTDGLRTAMAQCGQACLRWWASLDRKGRSLVVCGGLATVALLVVAIAVSAHKSGDDARNLETLKSAPENTSTRDPRPLSALFAPPGDAHVKAGLAAASRGDWDLAHREFTAAIEFNRNNAKAYCGRAWAYFESVWAETHNLSNGRIDEIVKDCTIASQLDPNDPAPFFVRGCAWLTSFSPEMSLPPLTEAIRLAPNNPSYYVMRAYAREHIDSYRYRGDCGLLPLPVADCSEAIRVDPNYAIAYVCRGWCLNKLNQKHEAQADFDKALSMSQAEVTPELIQRGINPLWYPGFVFDEMTRGLLIPHVKP